VQEVEAGDRVTDARQAHRQARRQSKRHVVGPGHADLLSPSPNDAEMSGCASVVGRTSNFTTASCIFPSRCPLPPPPSPPPPPRPLTVTPAHPRRRRRHDAEGFVPTVVGPLALAPSRPTRTARRYEGERRRRRR